MPLVLFKKGGLFVPQTLDPIMLADVKNYLDITYDDVESDKKLTGIILRGQNRLKDISSNPLLSFEEGARARELLFDYCRYARSNALEMFELNFSRELIALRLTSLTEVMPVEN